MENTKQPLTNLQAIKTFFENEPNGRKVTMEEMKKLSATEREEIAVLCREVLSAIT